VVGAGVIGAAIAEELASRGTEVRVIDPREPGHGATQASAGMLVPYVEGHAGGPLQALCLASIALYDAFVARVTERAGLPVEFRRIGSLQVAFDADGRHELEADGRRLADAGVDHRVLDGPEVLELEPRLSPAIVAGLLVPQHAYVHAPALVAALVASASRAGAVFTRAAVERVAHDGGTVALHTSSGRIDADAVVLAGGCWSGQVALDAPALPVRPVRGQIVHVRFDAPPVSHLIWGAGGYMVPWQDGTLLVGATVEEAGFDERSTAAGVHGLIEMGVRLLPGAAHAAFHEVRVGLRPGSGDELPVIGRSSTMPRVFYATGHYRNGVLLAPLTAALVADLVLDGREGEALGTVSPTRFGL